MPLTKRQVGPRQSIVKSASRANVSFVRSFRTLLDWNQRRQGGPIRFPVPADQERILSLDGRLAIADIRESKRVPLVREWLQEAAADARVERRIAARLRGAVFEVRQGYKSKDSKRQNADIGNAANAYASSYLPVVALLSAQIDSDIEERYARAQWLILKGSPRGSRIKSTYVFFRDVLGYDLAEFFKRNSPQIKREVEAIIEALLR